MLGSKGVVIKAHGCPGWRTAVTAVPRVQGWQWERRGHSTALASFLRTEKRHRSKSRGTRNKKSLFRS